jgi:hypothetical protein
MAAPIAVACRGKTIPTMKRKCCYTDDLPETVVGRCLEAAKVCRSVMKSFVACVVHDVAELGTSPIQLCCALLQCDASPRRLSGNEDLHSEQCFDFLRSRWC